MGELMSSSREIMYDEGLTDYADKYRKTIQREILQEIREEIMQIKATQLYSTIDLKDMVLAIIDKHMEEHHD